MKMHSTNIRFCRLHDPRDCSMVHFTAISLLFCRMWSKNNNSTHASAEYAKKWSIDSTKRTKTRTLFNHLISLRTASCSNATNRGVNSNCWIQSSVLDKDLNAMYRQHYLNIHVTFTSDNISIGGMLRIVLQSSHVNWEVLSGDLGDGFGCEQFRCGTVLLWNLKCNIVIEDLKIIS